MRLYLIVLLFPLSLVTACGPAPADEMSAMDVPAEEVPAGVTTEFGESLIRPGASPPDLLMEPDPAQMEDAPPLGYGPVPHGLQIPVDLELGAPSSVAWTGEDRLLLFNRGPNPLALFEADGTFVRSWGQGQYVRPHGMRLDAEGNIWATDVNGHTVRKMSPEGDVLMTLGVHEEVGEWEVGASEGLLMEPTDLGFGHNGEIYLIIGHGNGPPAILKFDSAGTLLAKWGSRGTGPGEFDTPHSVVVDAEGLVHIADRQNRRVQIFDADGNYLSERQYKGLPCGLYIHDDQQMYMVSGFSGEILKLDEDGKAIGATGQPGPGLGEFGEAHYMTIASNGDIYVADTVKPGLHKYAKKM